MVSTFLIFFKPFAHAEILSCSEPESVYCQNFAFRLTGITSVVLVIVFVISTAVVLG